MRSAATGPAWCDVIAQHVIRPEVWEFLFHASEEEAGDARGDDDDVAQYIGLERTTFWGPYHCVTDLGEACWYMEQFWFDLMGSRDRPILGIDVKCYYGEVCMVQLSSWRRGLLLLSLIHI